MPSSKFHHKPFDEGTLTKLNLFELYTREWLPVFQASPTPQRTVIHLFDFFAGPGTDSKGTPDSPIRLLKQVAQYRGQPGWKNSVSSSTFSINLNPRSIGSRKTSTS